MQVKVDRVSLLLQAVAKYLCELSPGFDSSGDRFIRPEATWTEDDFVCRAVMQDGLDY